MQVIPRISGERLASLPAGARLSFDNQIITINHCRGGWVNYTDAAGARREYEVAVVAASATERLDATPCQCCGVLRMRSDLIKKRIKLPFRDPENLLVCDDVLCTALHISVRTPASSMPKQDVKGRYFKRSGYVSK
ncbi:hypothetical protein [Serratia quinivorans]|uniref:hypothetical protein n=1 Tax=Serratia quinivorans TaxID=137545 RepID=UPI00217746A9|nr:hypothetical protein [Serratia quinivorans]CAI1109290.1 Uncharacterised protein [Serratia quinivorans]HEJ7884135.1 hypothetical protein [Serratia liquefaciens]